MGEISEAPRLSRYYQGVLNAFLRCCLPSLSGSEMTTVGDE